MKKGRLFWKKITLIMSLICFLLIVVGMLYYFFLYPNRALGLEGDAKDLHYDRLGKIHNQDFSVRFDNFVFFTVKGIQYTNISPEERVKYGLLEESFVKEMLTPNLLQQGKSPDWYKHNFVRGDIGKKIGTIEESNHSMLVGVKVYHYSAYPDSDDICIVKLGGDYGYEFFVDVSTRYENP